ncbi:MAG: helix-turn-helix domain-containing protein [Deltaproteobacteria bacterium]|nr:helix-turn-helix domain-containing protein [Deltaproteobacteria bacterium]
MSGTTSSASTRFGPDVYFLVLPGTGLLDLSGFAETLRAAAQRGAPLRLHYVGPADLPVSSLGLRLGGVEPLPERLPEGAALVIPGVDRCARDYLLPEARAAAGWLRRAVGPGHLLCTVCSGAFLAAEAGLLDGRACTTHHSLTDRLQREHPRLRVLENRVFVRDGNVLTSAGVTAGVDLALHLVSELAGPRVAVEVARLLVLYFRRGGDDPQLSPWLLHRNHIDPRVHGAQDLVARDPTHAWTAEELAARVHTSTRHLGRLFQAYAGISPLAYLRKIRSASARELLRDPSTSVEQVAETVGFQSADQLRRAFRRFESALPSELRAAPPGRRPRAARSA